MLCNSTVVHNTGELFAAPKGLELKVDHMQALSPMKQEIPQNFPMRWTALTLFIYFVCLSVCESYTAGCFFEAIEGLGALFYEEK